MSKRIIHTVAAPSPIGPYSQAVLAGNLLFISGQIAIDPETGQLQTDDLDAETELVMRNIGAVLQEAGMDYHNVVKCSIFLSDMNDFARVNAIYGRFFTDNPPARETVEVSRLPKDVHVEISVIAAV